MIAAEVTFHRGLRQGILSAGANGREWKEPVCDVLRVSARKERKLRMV